MLPLFIDIGKGTQDILIPLKGKNPENWIKAVLPSPTSKFAEEIRKVRKDLSIDGKIMGGGPLKKALLGLVDAGFKVTLTKAFSRTIRDDLQEVERYGFEIVENLDNPDFYFQDLDFNLFKTLLDIAGVKESLGIVGVACQDHGFIKGQSDRVTRFQLLKQFLEKSRSPFDFFIMNKTGVFSRFDSILEQLQENGVKGFVVDSKIASVCGIMVYAEELGIREFVGLDIGNGHTLGVTIKNGKIAGLFEHHTRLLTPEKLKALVEKLINGKLSFEEVYEDGGHGALVFESIKPERILVAGPNRLLFRRYGEFAYPFGDVMITGCVGLYKIYHKNLQN